MSGALMAMSFDSTRAATLSFFRASLTVFAANAPWFHSASAAAGSNPAAMAAASSVPVPAVFRAIRRDLSVIPAPSILASAVAYSKSPSPVRIDEMARFAAGLFEQSDRIDAHRTICRFAHVIDRQETDAHRRQRLHLDP